MLLDQLLGIASASTEHSWTLLLYMKKQVFSCQHGRNIATKNIFIFFFWRLIIPARMAMTDFAKSTKLISLQINELCK
jgi:hypothetical protein